MDLLIPPAQQAALAALTDPLNFPTEYLGWLDDRIKLVGGRSATAVTTTTSAMSGGPPSTAADGDIWFASGVDANGTRWMFQYNAGSGSSFKWEFVGGAPLTAEVGGSDTTVSVAYVDGGTVGPSITLPRAGDYKIRFGVNADNNTAGQFSIASVTRGASAASDTDFVVAESSAGGAQASVARLISATGVAASDVYKVQYRVTGGTGTFKNRWIEGVPVRVS